MAYVVEIDTKAAKEIKGFPRRDQLRILAKIENFSVPSTPRRIGKAGRRFRFLASPFWRLSNYLPD